MIGRSKEEKRREDDESKAEWACMEVPYPTAQARESSRGPLGTSAGEGRLRLVHGLLSISLRLHCVRSEMSKMGREDKGVATPQQDQQGQRGPGGFLTGKTSWRFGGE